MQANHVVIWRHSPVSTLRFAAAGDGLGNPVDDCAVAQYGVLKIVYSIRQRVSDVFTARAEIEHHFAR